MRHIRSMAVGVGAGLLVFALGAGAGWADAARGCGGGHSFGTGHSSLRHGGTSHRLYHLLKHKQDLNLTEEQITKLKGLSLDQDRARIQAHASVMIAGRELRSLLSDDNTELSVIEAKVHEQESLEANVRMIGIKGKRDLYAVLTAEQREKYNTLREQMRHGSGSHMMKADSSESADSDDRLGATVPRLAESLTAHDDAPSS